MDIKRRLRFFIFISGAFLLLISGRSYAEDNFYQIVSDPELTVSYDGKTGDFIYGMPNGGTFRMNVPLGGISGKPVTISTGEKAWIVSMTKDGESCLPESKRYESVSDAVAAVYTDRITEKEVNYTGAYLFHVRSSTSDKKGIKNISTIGSFLIATEGVPICKDRLITPYGYRLKELILDGHSIGYTDEAMPELPQDGRYEVLYEPVLSGLPEWRSVFVRDATAPELVFDKPIEKGTVEGPVRFYPTENGAEILILLNGKETELSNMTAAADGEYRIRASDRTGNENEYEFRVKSGEKPPVTMYILIAAVLISAAALVIVSAHRRMRII